MNPAAIYQGEPGPPRQFKKEKVLVVAKADVIRANNKLPALANDQVLELELRQMLGDSRPRSTDQVGDVLVAERGPEQHAARFLDSEIGGQIEQRDGNAFAKIESQETGAAQ